MEVDKPNDAPTEKRDPGQIAIVDATNDKQVGNIETDPELRPGAIVSNNWDRGCYNERTRQPIVVIDRKNGTILTNGLCRTLSGAELSPWMKSDTDYRGHTEPVAGNCI